MYILSTPSVYVEILEQPISVIYWSYINGYDKLIDGINFTDYDIKWLDKHVHIYFQITKINRKLRWILTLTN